MDSPSFADAGAFQDGPQWTEFLIVKARIGPCARRAEKRVLTERGGAFVQISTCGGGAPQVPFSLVFRVASFSISASISRLQDKISKRAIREVEYVSAVHGEEPFEFDPFKAQVRPAGPPCSAGRAQGHPPALHRGAA
jgi:hypothetical protein